MFRAFVVVHHAGVLHILGGFQQVRPYDILAFLGPPVFLVFLLHVTFCLFFGPLALDLRNCEEP